MATTSNFGWETPDDTDYVKDGAAAMRTLGNAIDASLADLEGGTTGQVLSKNSNTDMDFVWITPDDADAIQNTIVDAKGDLITATAPDTPARLGVGSDGQVLTADSTAGTGIKWATPAASISPTIVDAKGDLIAATAADTVSRLAVGTNGQVLTADSSAATGLTWSTPLGGILRYQDFAATGSWTAPSGVTSVMVLAVGGGGGGAASLTGGNGAGGGGGGGAVVWTSVAVTPGTTYTCTIGAGGTAGAASGSPSANGGNGGQTSFGTLVYAGGGGGGGTRGTAGAAGSGTNPGGGGGGGAPSNTTCFGGGGGGTSGPGIGWPSNSAGGAGGTYGGVGGWSVFSGSALVLPPPDGGPGWNGMGGGGGGAHFGANLGGRAGAGGGAGASNVVAGSGNGGGASFYGGGGGGGGTNSGGNHWGGGGGGGFIRLHWVA